LWAKLIQKFGVQIPIKEGKKFLSPFLFIIIFSIIKVEKKYYGKKFDPSPWGFESRIFEQNFPAQYLNFEGY